MVDNVLIGRTRLRECIQLIHVVHVAPQRFECIWNFEIDKILTSHSDVLKSWHQFTIETTDRVCKMNVVFFYQ